MVRVRGKVVSGRADFGQWIERLADFYEQKTGMRLYPGTLNVELPSEYSLPADVIRLEGDEYGGRVSVSMVPCRILNRKAFLLRMELDITRAISSRSPLTYGCATSIN
jgi:riboflavin kinase, archaea type